MPDTTTQRYAASAFKYVNHPNGSALFFDLDGQPAPRDRRAGGDAIYRVTIEEVRSADDLDGVGFRTRNTAIIELPRDDFRRRLARLRERDLNAAPIVFEFSVNEEGSLQELQIDGQRIEPRADRPSDVAPKGGTPIVPGAKRSG